MSSGRFRVDWDDVYEAMQPYAVFVAGVLFGLAWWLWADAAAVSIVVQHAAFNWWTIAPGLGATLAVCIMNCVSRDDLESTYNDDAHIMRSRLVLVLSYMLSVGAVVGAVALLLHMDSQARDKDTARGLWVGAASIMQACFILASGMVAWFFHKAPDNLYYI